MADDDDDDEENLKAAVAAERKSSNADTFSHERERGVSLAAPACEVEPHARGAARDGVVLRLEALPGGTCMAHRQRKHYPPPPLFARRRVCSERTSYTSRPRPTLTCS